MLDRDILTALAAFANTEPCMSGATDTLTCAHCLGEEAFIDEYTLIFTHADGCPLGVANRALTEAGALVAYEEAGCPRYDLPVKLAGDESATSA